VGAAAVALAAEIGPLAVSSVAREAGGALAREAFGRVVADGVGVAVVEVRGALVDAEPIGEA
jgi:hypothetical protein